MGDDVIDVIHAYSLMRGDSFKHDGVAYLALVVEDEGDLIYVEVEPVDSTEADDLVILHPEEVVQILGFAA